MIELPLALARSAARRWRWIALGVAALAAGALLALLFDRAPAIAAATIQGRVDTPVLVEKSGADFHGEWNLRALRPSAGWAQRVVTVSDPAYGPVPGKIRWRYAPPDSVFRLLDYGQQFPADIPIPITPFPLPLDAPPGHGRYCVVAYLPNNWLQRFVWTPYVAYPCLEFDVLPAPAPPPSVPVR